MSIAEQTARNIYETYHFAELPNDVKRHLVFLFFSQNCPDTDIQEEEVTVLPFANDEDTLRSRAMQAYIEIQEGKSYPAEEMMERLESKYPWLCE